jgi:WD40 repeat protein
VVIAGAIRLQPPELSLDPVTNGWIAFAANGDAGDDLLGTDVGRNGDGDIYFAREGQSPRRVMGDDQDQASVMCAAFSPDGRSLAVTELDLGSLTPTPPPIPADDDILDTDVEPPGLEPEAQPEPAPLAWRIVVAGIDDAGEVTTLTQVGASPDLSSCAKWSPDGRRLGYVTTDQEDRQQLSIVSLDGRTSALGAPTALGDTTNYGSQAGSFEWAPDGATIALLGDERLWLLPVEGGDARELPGPGFQSVRWSPDGTRLAIGLRSLIRLIATDGTSIADIPVDMEGDGPPPFAWSPDGRALAYAEGDALVTVSPEGAELQRVPLDVGAILGEPLTSYPPFVLAWSPDGRSVLIGAGGVDRWGSIIAVRMGGDHGATGIAGPTFALRAVSASWQAVHG